MVANKDCYLFFGNMATMSQAQQALDQFQQRESDVSSCNFYAP